MTTHHPESGRPDQQRYPAAIRGALLPGPGILSILEGDYVAQIRE
jgi:hypothetical protein